ncbi:MAG: MaoC/PaaZ C-terminal domain-containing protein [Archangium sp.]
MLSFDRSPSLWSLYPRILAARKPARVGDGGRVPRLDGALRGVRIDMDHLQKYRDLCGFRGDDVPVTYPHVLASGLHLAMLSSPDFPVRLMGLVHVANRIEQRGPLSTSSSGEFVAWLEGHRDTGRGQEFDLHTEWRQGTGVPWRETMTFLSRAPKKSGKSAPEKVERAVADETFTFDAPSDIGRRYGPLAGDVNPIHLFDVTAKLFGFRRAIAHGMWSLARCVSHLSSDGPRTLEVQFKLPVLLPAKLVMERRDVDFVLLDEKREKPHLSGRFSRA